MFFRFALFTLVVVVVSAAKLHTKQHPMDGKRQAGVKAMVVIDGMNYFFGTGEEITWYEAQTACTGMNMQLLELKDQAKSDTILQWMAANPDYDEWSWIGLHREVGVDMFLWDSDGTAPGYTSWGEEQPSNSLQYATCTNIQGAYGAWDDDNCNVSYLAYICEE